MKGINLKVTKSNAETLIESGKSTRFGLNWPGKRCLAKTRSGSQCQKPALKGKRRCQLHGGLTPKQLNPEQRQRDFRAEIAEIGVWAQNQGFSF